MNLLIISNRVLSRTDNNGKTLLSLMGNLQKANISQLYFYGNMPEVEGFRYFQLSDGDIIKGKINKNKRGRSVTPIGCSSLAGISSKNLASKKRRIKRTALILQIRELLWKDSWKSNQLEEWLDKSKPDAIFFMAGDCIYAYDICMWIQGRYKSKLYTYVTDDYILKRRNERIFDAIHRKGVYKVLKECASQSNVFFTICERMRNTYKEEINVDSELLFNRCESLYDPQIASCVTDSKKIVFLYAGSLYYGREQILIQLAKVIAEINNSNNNDPRTAELHIYTNERPTDDIIKQIEDTQAGFFKGSLTSDELKVKLNQCDYPVFVESFDGEQIEKTRLSFSTKIPEYLSLRKLIIAIGPNCIGSMDCLSRAAVCINDISKLKNTIKKVLNSEYEVQDYAKASEEEYLKLKNLRSFETYLE